MRPYREKQRTPRRSGEGFRAAASFLLLYATPNTTRTDSVQSRYQRPYDEQRDMWAE